MRATLQKILFRLMFVYCACFIAGSRGTSLAKNPGRAQFRIRTVAEITQHDLENAISTAEDQIQKLATFENNILMSGLAAEKQSPFYDQMVDFLASDEALNNTRSAFVVIKASQYLASKFCLRSYVKNKQCTDELSSLKLSKTSLGKVCTDIYEHIQCKTESGYRSVDGACNNIENSSWGKSNTAYKRLLKPDYDDGLHTLRSSVDGKELPSPRLVSTKLAETKRILDQTKTQASVIWGLFIGHDMSHTPASNMVNLKNRITCCTSDGRPLPPRHNHISCASISIPHTDIFYNKFFQTCMNYVRSLPAMRRDCTFGPTEQMNQASHFLDGSVIYGSTDKKMKSLRSMWGGRLITTLQKNGEEYPPIVNSSDIPCRLTNISDCFTAGDTRVNSQPQLTVLHTLFVREHNRIADRLSTLNDHWDDERLFQEARKIVIAEIQHITYNHWLPRVIGKKFVESRGLYTSFSGFNNSHDEGIDPTVSNSFATAGLPLIYSMIDGNIGLYTEDRNVTHITDLRQPLVKSSLPTNEVNTNYFDSIVRGLATQNSQQIHEFSSDAFTQFWYGSGDFGMDLLSIDIQRGRDHGIPAYSHFRKYCNLSEITSFKDLRGIASQNTINRLESVYKKVADIDLLVGMISELPAKEAMVGPTLQCLLAEQLSRSKFGDTFFYDNQNHPGSFTEEQLEQIKRSTLARIFCDNSNNVRRMQKDVFLVPDKNSNQLLNCHQTVLPFINLAMWKEDNSSTGLLSR